MCHVSRLTDTVASLTSSLFTLVYLSSRVIRMRGECDVSLPTMYASTAKNSNDVIDAKSITAAHKFNRTQRGHQNALETAGSMQILTAVGGVYWPVVSAGGLVLWQVGQIAYAIQYTQATEKRNKGLAGCKYLGMLTLIVTNVSFAVSLLTK